MRELDEFLFPRRRYRGPSQPKYLLFNANLQEFSQRVGYISALHTNGKLNSAEAYGQLRQLWKELKHRRRQFEIGQDPGPDAEGSSSSSA